MELAPWSPQDLSFSGPKDSEIHIHLRMENPSSWLVYIYIHSFLTTAFRLVYPETFERLCRVYPTRWSSYFVSRASVSHRDYALLLVLFHCLAFCPKIGWWLQEKHMLRKVDSQTSKLIHTIFTSEIQAYHVSCPTSQFTTSIHKDFLGHRWFSFSTI